MGEEGRRSPEGLRLWEAQAEHLLPGCARSDPRSAPVRWEKGAPVSERPWGLHLLPPVSPFFSWELPVRPPAQSPPATPWPALLPGPGPLGSGTSGALAILLESWLSNALQRRGPEPQSLGSGSSGDHFRSSASASLASALFSMKQGAPQYPL